ncbi:hypothetical protein V1289_007291 [Bradyrhizobium sp. AZCC 2289]
MVRSLTERDFFLLPLWEKVATGGLRPPFFFARTPMLCIGYTKSAPDEGSLSAETDPSSVFASRSHLLPQGEKGSKGRPYAAAFGKR